MVASDLGLKGLEAGELLEGSLLKWNTINGYILAIAKIHSLQRLLKTNLHPSFWGSALNSLLDSRCRAQHTYDRAAYIDRGATGLASGYTEDEFLQLQESLLKGLDICVQVS